LSPNFNIKLS